MVDFLAEVNGWKPCCKGLGYFFVLIPEFDVFNRIRVHGLVLKSRVQLIQLLHHFP